MAQARKTGGGARKRPTKSEIQIPGEKAIRGTDQSLPVKPPKRSKVADRPTDPAAVDQRRQIIGTDEPKDKTRGR